MDITQEGNTPCTTGTGEGKRQRCSVPTGSPTEATTRLSEGGFLVRSALQEQFSKTL